MPLMNAMKKRMGWVVLATLPALIVAIAAIRLNHFALIDDGVTILSARTWDQVKYFFAGMNENKRYLPMYFFYHFVLFKLLPVRPWVLALGNGGFLLAAVLLIFRLGNRLSGPWAGLLAAWLFTLNICTADNLFTLSKPEPQQLPFWLLSFGLLANLWLDDRPDPKWRTGLYVFFTTLIAVLFKETGVLLIIPWGLLAVVTWWKRSDLSRTMLLHRLLACTMAIIPLAIIMGVLIVLNLQPGSYAALRLLHRATLQSTWLNLVT